MSNKKPIGGRQDIRDRLFPPVTDPKARVVEIAIEGWNAYHNYPLVAHEVESLADHLLASVPVAPSVDTLRSLLIKHSSFASVTRAGCEEIRNHLLTIGWRDK